MPAATEKRSRTQLITEHCVLPALFNLELTPQVLSALSYRLPAASIVADKQ